MSLKEFLEKCIMEEGRTILNVGSSIFWTRSLKMNQKWKIRKLDEVFWFTKM